MTGFLSDPAAVARIRDEVAAGRPVALASILATSGSMPRHEGARMARLASGELLGTVGGGNIELMATERLEALAAGAAPSITWVRHEDSEMACGGDALLATRMLGADEAPTCDALVAMLEGGGAGVVVESWADSARPTMALEDAGHAKLGWSESAAVYREAVGAPSTCHVFGVGHVGAALVPLLPPLGFKVAAYDDRPDCADPAGLAAADTVTCGAFAKIAAEAPIASADSVVVLTHGHAADIEVLEQVLRRDCAYVGCIGSRRKAQIVRDRLVEAGIDPARANAVHLPIGEEILAVTPQEIALAIAAQLVHCRAEWRAGR